METVFVQVNVNKEVIHFCFRIGKPIIRLIKVDKSSNHIIDPDYHDIKRDDAQPLLCHNGICRYRE